MEGPIRLSDTFFLFFFLLFPFFLSFFYGALHFRYGCTARIPLRLPLFSAIY